MSAGKYPSIFSCQREAIVNKKPRPLIFSARFNQFFSLFADGFQLRAR